jgi:hypothetical protein
LHQVAWFRHGEESLGMRWKMALIQHPMYLLIKEDTECAERIPPWGAASVGEYVLRIKRNLEVLREHPLMKIGYEWSALELEQLRVDAPEVVEEMCGMAAAGRVAFYNGTYAQPHLQVLGSESNLRQFEYGLRLLRDTCRQPILVYAHQEASVHDQLPQLLRAFGIKYGVVPDFVTTLAWLEGGEIVVAHGHGPRFVQGQELANWRGLDGTEIPLYLHQHIFRGEELEDWLARETILGKLSIPPLIVSMPDMLDVDDAWMSTHEGVEYVLLNQVLEERLREAPPRASVRLFTNWSYIEGIRAEELSRRNWEAEAIVLQAEAMEAMGLALTKRSPRSTDALWRALLRAQHHDCYCFSAPELRSKAIEHLRGVTASARRMVLEAGHALASDIDLSAVAGTPLLVFNAMPKAQSRPVCVVCDTRNPRVVDHLGCEVASEGVKREDGSVELRFIAPADGFGYRTFWLQQGGEEARGTETDGPCVFDNAYYRAMMEPDGTFASIVVKPSNCELLDTSALRGNQLAGVDSTGLSPKRVGPPDLNHREMWTPPNAGLPLTWVPRAPSTAIRSSLGLTLYAYGQMGPQATVDCCIRCYRELPWIDVTWTMAFKDASIGTFFDDDSKLRVLWPLARVRQVRHDIPFGVVDAAGNRPFFPASWVDLLGDEGSFAYLHQGTPKHWMAEGVLVNLLAWGEDTDAIGNRLWRQRWPKPFDQRLRGTHTFNSSLYPHVGDWRSAGVIDCARAHGIPPAVVVTNPHEGLLPPCKTLLTLPEPEIEATALFVRDGQLICRVHAPRGREARGLATTDGLSRNSLRALTGAIIEQLGPFQIGELAMDVAE